jgi:acyl carrier protein
MKSRVSIADIVIQNIKIAQPNLIVNESDSFESLGLGIYEATLFTQRIESEFKIKYSDAMLLDFHKKSVREIINNIYSKL